MNNNASITTHTHIHTYVHPNKYIHKRTHTPIHAPTHLIGHRVVIQQQRGDLQAATGGGEVERRLTRVVDLVDVRLENEEQ